VIVVTTCFAVPEGRESDFEQRLRAGVQALERPPGLIRNEVLRPCGLRFDPARGQFAPDPRRARQYEVKTWWRNLQDFEDWTQNLHGSARTSGAQRALRETFIVAESLEVHEVFLEFPRSGQR
jgi:heme-degrading monooxygenase HmoA